MAFMFEQAFRNIDDVLRREAGSATEAMLRISLPHPASGGELCRIP